MHAKPDGYYLVREFAHVRSPEESQGFLGVLDAHDLASMWLRIQELEHWIGTEVIVREAMERLLVDRMRKTS